MEKAKIRRIAVVLRLSYASGRDLLYGISQYARRKCRWQFHVINFQGDATAEELHSAVEEGKLDGMIANAADNHAIAKVLEASTIPLVVIGARTSLLTRKDTIAFVHNDEIAIGRRGAEYLASIGRFRSYGFIALSIDSCEYVPVLRERGFRSALGNVGCDVRTYATAVNVKLGSYDDINRLGEWLKALPKPAAIMAAHDLRATHVIEAANASGLVIPNDIALVGVDNDELVCETSEPTLTSIAPDHVRLGELAAACLRRIMANPSSMSFESLLPVKTVIERQSTRHVTPSAQLVERATSYIRRNALKGIGAVDVVSHLGVSRRLADVRFRQATGQSILSAIMKTRLDEVKRRLRDTDTPIAKITAACGFHGENYAKKLFKSRFGVSMTKWRAQHTIA